MSIFLKMSRVARNENLFIFFQNGNKNCRVGTKKSGSVGLAETQLFFRPKHTSKILVYDLTYLRIDLQLSLNESLEFREPI